MRAGTFWRAKHKGCSIEDLKALVYNYQKQPVPLEFEAGRFFRGGLGAPSELHGRKRPLNASIQARVRFH